MAPPSAEWEWQSVNVQLESVKTNAVEVDSVWMADPLPVVRLSPWNEQDVNCADCISDRYSNGVERVTRVSD